MDLIKSPEAYQSRTFSGAGERKSEKDLNLWGTVM
jgi:hypothetical protein